MSKKRAGTSKNSSKTSNSSHQRFVCPVKFKNDLPDLPFDPKLLEYPLDQERHFIYRPTTLEKEEKQEMLLEPDLGIPINLIDPLAYFCSQEGKDVGLDEEDMALLNDHNKSDKIDESISPWIRRPEYLVADFGQETIYGPKANTPSFSAHKAPTLDHVLCLEVDAEAHIEAIEQTFLDSTLPPQHPTNPELTPVEILDFLPDFGVWKYDLMHINFHENPAPNWPEKDDPEFDMKAEEQKDLVSRSLLVPLELDDGADFSAFLSPKWGDFDDLESFNELDISEREYSFTREYTHSMIDTSKQDRDIFIFVDTDKQTAHYSQITCRIRMKKRPKKHGDHFSETITLTSIEPTIEDQERQNMRLMALKPKIVVDAMDEDDQDDMEERKAKDIFGDSDSD